MRQSRCLPRLLPKRTPLLHTNLLRTMPQRPCTVHVANSLCAHMRAGRARSRLQRLDLKCRTSGIWKSLSAPPRALSAGPVFTMFSAQTAQLPALGSRSSELRGAAVERSGRCCPRRRSLRVPSVVAQAAAAAQDAPRTARAPAWPDRALACPLSPPRQEKVASKSVAAVILGGGAGTRLYRALQWPAGYACADAALVQLSQNSAPSLRFRLAARTAS